MEAKDTVIPVEERIKMGFMKEQVAKIMFQFAFLIDDKDIDDRWTWASSNEKARFYYCAEVVIPIIQQDEFLKTTNPIKRMSLQ